MSVDLVDLEPASEGKKYMDYSICPKCGGRNSIVVRDAIEGVICECETKCDVCFHIDYWGYGWYQTLFE